MKTDVTEAIQIALRLTPALVALLALAGVSGAGEGPAGSLSQDFDASVARIRGAIPGGRELSGRELPPGVRTGLDLYWGEAKALAKAHGPLATDFLLAQVNETRPGSGRTVTHEFALATLAALAVDEDAARTLARYVIDDGFRDQSALMAVTYAPPAFARGLGREALKASPRSDWALRAAGSLLRLFGEPADVEALRQIVEAPLPPHMAIEAMNRAAVAADLLALRQRLSRPPGQQAAWAEQDRAVWRALYSRTTNDHSKYSNLKYIHRGLITRGRLRTDYLRDRLVASPINSDELILVIWTVADQRENALIPELVALAVGKRDRRGYALDALLSLNTPEGFKAVRRLIPPPPTQPANKPAPDRDQDAGDGRRAWIYAYLVNHSSTADRATADFWNELSADTAYPPEERAAFAQARDRVRLMITPGTMGGPRP